MPIVDEVQARLDSYKSDRERKRRLATLTAMGESAGHVELDVAIEVAVLMIRLKGRRMVVTAQQMSDDLLERAAAGQVRVHVERDGELVQVPPEVIARGRPH